MVGHFRIDLRIAQIWSALDQCHCLHDHSRLAVAALRNILFQPCPLAGMTPVNGKTLNGCVPFTGCRREWYLAGTYGDPIFVHSTCATHAHTTTVLGSGELEEVTQGPK